jgi:predicted outer membrane protein
MKLAKAAKLEDSPHSQLDQRHQVIANSLKDAKGGGFDTAFAEAQVAAHQ